MLANQVEGNTFYYDGKEIKVMHEAYQVLIHRDRFRKENDVNPAKIYKIFL